MSLITTARMMGLFCLAVMAQLSFARVGCIDNSFHLRKWPDFKQYHYVQCSCPCTEFTHVAGRDKCLKCGHFHAPQPPAVVPKALWRGATSKEQSKRRRAKIHITKAGPSIHFATQNTSDYAKATTDRQDDRGNYDT